MAQVPTLFVFSGCVTSKKIARILRPSGTSGRTFLAVIGDFEDRGPWFDPLVDPTKLRLRVIKVASSRDNVEALIKEHRTYTRLVHLQDVVIPICYGYYTGKSDVNNLDVHCLELEYCVAGADYVEVEADLYRNLMNGISAIHAAGYVHGGLLDRRHIVVRGDSLRIINLSKATSDHKCDDLIYPGLNGKPSEQTRCCAELAAINIRYGLKSNNPPPYSDDLPLWAIGLSPRER